MTHSKRRRLRRNHRTPHFNVEGLEDRRMLATFTVTNTNDAGDGSLRRAVQLANATPGVDEVLFDTSLTDLMITLTSGEIRVSQAVTIDGEQSNVIIDASGSDPTPAVNDGMGSRVFHVTDGVGDESNFFAEFRNLTITGADVEGDGGGINSRQVLRMYDMEIRDSHATGSGGGIHAEKLVRVEDSIISGNSAGAFGGGAHYSFSTENGYGGYPIRFYRTEFLDNYAASGGGGLFANVLSNNPANELLINESRFAGNHSVTGGGGLSVSNYFDIPIRIHSSTIEDNSTDGFGGGISITNYQRDSEIRDTIIQNNTAANGGGIMLNTTSGAAEEMLIVNSQINDNEATTDGGGVFARHRVRFEQSQITGNTAGELGGGLVSRGYYSYVNIVESIIDANSASRGGGIAVDGYGAYLDLEMSNVIYNSATEAGGGLWLNVNEVVDVSQSTISGNTAGSAGGIFARAAYNSSLQLTSNTITANIAENTSSNAIGGLDLGGSFARISHNIIFGNLKRADGRTESAWDVTVDPVPYFADFNLIGNIDETLDDTNLIGVNPLLGSLTDNGGATLTYALLPGSPAIDAGNPDLANIPVSDQRGLPFVRSADGDDDGVRTIDIGSFELQAGENQPPVAIAGDDVSIRPNETILLDGGGSTDPDDGPASLTYSWEILSGPETGMLATPDAVTTEFTASEAGDYVVQLSIFDGLSMATDDLVITVLTNGIPIADSSLSQTTGEIGMAVILDGTLSSDPEDDSLTYQWTLLEQPAGSAITLTDATLDVASFIPDVEGIYRAELVVSDAFDSSLPSEVVVVVGAVSSWHNAAFPEDVNSDEVISPLDALLVINELSDRLISDSQFGEVFGSRPEDAPFLDVNNDSIIAPLDALLVVNALGMNPSAAFIDDAVHLVAAMRSQVASDAYEKLDPDWIRERVFESFESDV